MSTTTPEMPRIQVPPNLPDLVKTAFNKARSNGDLTYYPTQVALLHVNSIPFQLRFSPSLANKPKAPKPPTPSTPSSDKTPFNPFANPSPALLIAPLENHNLILNKFAIVPEHFILSTKTFKPQTHLLEDDDLEAAYACIQAYERAGRELFVFFNAGEGSGASQGHRHLQLLDVERMREGVGEGWDVLAKGLGGLAQEKLPFWTVAEEIRSGEDLREMYLRLYSRACEKVLGDRVDVRLEGEAQISYNLAMTRDVMVVCPRLTEGAAVRDREGKEVGWLALNGTVLAGTALVKNQAEWDALRADPGQVAAVLGKIGVENKKVGSA